jgi:hypothetical protein
MVGEGEKKNKCNAFFDKYFVWLSNHFLCVNKFAPKKWTHKMAKKCNFYQEKNLADDGEKLVWPLGSVQLLITNLQV